eukprot:GEZU01029450.1.p2 GENE.GEZU01029450.1~~GEZU01029450.1.p2  ORF type:complete len:377 (-),score=168.91 GEZU01029450.1:157-1287(-)
MGKVQVPAAKFLGFDHIHFYVGNALQAASYYVTRFGFKRFAYRGLETKSRDVVTHVVRQGKIIFAFSSPLQPENPEFSAFAAKHGDGVKDVAMTVEDARAIYEAAIANGAVSVKEPQEVSDEHGSVILASVQAYSDTIHTFVERKNYKGVFLPGYIAVEDNDPMEKITPAIGLEVIDHVVNNQGWDGIKPVEQWYIEKLGFHRFWSVDDKQIHTQYSSLRSVVMIDEDHTITLPINEPAEGIKKSQIQEYVEFYGGPGVQHIALRTENIIDAITYLKARGVKFLTVPSVYYDDLRKRLANSSVKVAEDLDTIQKLDILVDFDEEGYLLQIFTKPLEDRPTVFIEVIQRRNNNGFGVGNFKALFEAIERDQEARGNL